MHRRLRPLAFVSITILIVATGASAGDKLDRLGSVHFPVSCSAAVQPEFDRAVALLHSFFYTAAVEKFTAVGAADPSCGMAHWGVAMALWYPLWYPPSPAALKKGVAAVEKATAVGAKTQRERDYIAAIAEFYRGVDTLDHHARAEAYRRAMAEVARRYPDDREASLFYALALLATANPTDKTYANQLHAAQILEKIAAAEPDHPGAAHYLIHAYDFPPLAQRGLPAARRYGQIAPSVPHALHMPSHIFTQLGLWEDVIRSNRASEAAARELGDVPPQFHAIDYEVYAHLQLAQDAEARRAIGRLPQLEKADIERNHYPIAAIPARFAVERNRWSEAAALEVRSNPYDYSEAVTRFARALGAARSGDAVAARKEVERLAELHDALVKRKVTYWASVVEAERRGAAAWLALAERRPDEALTLARSAADLEDTTDKNPVTPAWIVTARDLLGDLLLELGQPAQALHEFEISLGHEPNRFNATYGAARAAELTGDREKARTYYGQLLALGAHADGERPELAQARAFVAK